MSDAAIRAQIYESFLRTGIAPASIELGDDEALRRLAAGRVIVLDDAGEILMAPPFSAVPTPFLVYAGKVRAFGNCIWDAMGIAAMMKTDAVIAASCGDCGASMHVDLLGGAVDGAGLIHFAVPARMWWQNVVFT
ncbi:MAG TPA: organomercurial lyase [Thermoanaerobaculia bacterium]|nr:organomercurial lyase [Thermoanaerobaculia bacterium]